MKIKLLIIILAICILMGIGAGVLFNSLRPEKIESVVGSFPREGMLEVLSASVELNTSILKGEKKDADYFTLYSTPGTAVYSVDLGKIEIDCIEISKKVLIGIPTPDLRLYVDEDGGEKTFEYQKNRFTGSAQEGYETFTIPDDIGGRYSVSTAVGLLAMAFADIDIREVMRGSLDAYNEYNNDDINTNFFFIYAFIPS